MTDLTSFVRHMRKAELHLHIEGTPEPELKFALAERNGIVLPQASAAELRASYASPVTHWLEIGHYAAYFGGYVTDNLIAAQRAAGPGADELLQLQRNAIGVAWLPWPSAASCRPGSSSTPAPRHRPTQHVACAARHMDTPAPVCVPAQPRGGGNATHRLGNANDMDRKAWRSSNSTRRASRSGLESAEMKGWPPCPCCPASPTRQQKRPPSLLACARR